MKSTDCRRSPSRKTAEEVESRRRKPSRVREMSFGEDDDRTLEHNVYLSWSMVDSASRRYHALSGGSGGSVSSLIRDMVESENLESEELEAIMITRKGRLFSPCCQRNLESTVRRPRLPLLNSTQLTSSATIPRISSRALHKESVAPCYTFFDSFIFTHPPWQITTMTRPVTWPLTSSLPSSSSSLSPSPFLPLAVSISTIHCIYYIVLTLLQNPRSQPPHARAMSAFSTAGRYANSNRAQYSVLNTTKSTFVAVHAAHSV